MQTAAIIFGAGKTGRGLAAALCERSGVPFGLVDRDADLIAELKAAGEYRLDVLGGKARVLRPAFAATLVSLGWQDAFNAAQLCFTAVVGSNFPALAPALAKALERRHDAGPIGIVAPLNIVTCENLARAAPVLRDAVANSIKPARRDAVLKNVGFVEAMVLTTCLGPADPKTDPLAVRAQNSFRLPCDAEAFVGSVPAINGLEPLLNFGRQLIRKIYTYNGINAVICYRGAELGYAGLAKAARDPRIAALAFEAGNEASAGLIGEYGFDAAEQERWRDAALAKFADASIPDPISRNAADPVRKLARDDRLVGPALLAIKHGREPRALARGIVAAANFSDEGKPPLLKQFGSLERVLAEVCKLTPSEPLFELVLRVAREPEIRV